VSGQAAQRRPTAAANGEKEEVKMISIQTNVAALYGQQNLNVNSAFQQTTINRLTSGYRINTPPTMPPDWQLPTRSAASAQS
jgi:hypothetical protein